jgi:hypothetical protein
MKGPVYKLSIDGTSVFPEMVTPKLKIEADIITLDDDDGLEEFQHNSSDEGK